MVNAQYRIEGDAIRTIEYAHVAIHDDKFVIASDYFDDLDIASPRNYVIVPPTGKEIHVTWKITADAPVLLEIYKGAAITDNGTSVLNFRPNLWSNKTAESMYHTPTISEAGTLVWKELLGGGAGGGPVAPIGGSTSGGEEIIVPNDQVLVLKVTATANDTKISVTAQYYEVTNGATKPRR